MDEPLSNQMNPKGDNTFNHDDLENPEKPQFFEYYVSTGLGYYALDMQEAAFRSFNRAFASVSKQTYWSAIRSVDEFGEYPLINERYYKAQKQVTEHTPHSEALYYKAATEYQLGHLNAARSTIKAALELSAQESNYWLLLGAIDSGLGYNQESVEALDKAVEFAPLNAELIYQVAKIFEDVGQREIKPQPFLEKLLDYYDKAIASKTTPYYEVYYDKAEWLTNYGKYDAALAVIDELLEIDSTLVNAWLNKGSILVDANRVDEAMICFEKAFYLDPENESTWVNKIYGLRLQDQNDAALAFINRLLEHHPNALILFLSAIEIYKTIGQFDKALALFDQTIERFPKNMQVVKLKAELHERLEQWDAAIDCHRTLMTYFPNEPHIYHQIGLNLMRKGEYEAALVSLNEAARLDPENPDIYLQIAEANLNLNKTIPALKNYLKSFSLDKKNTEPLIIIAEIYLQNDYITYAEDVLELARTVNPRDPNPYCLLGSYYFGKKNYNKAKPYLLKALHLNPKDGLVQLMLGICLYFEKSFHTALTHFDNALADDEQNTIESGYYFKAMTLIKLRKYNEAVACFEVLIESQNQQFDFWQPAGDCYLKLQLYDKALTCYRQVIDNRTANYKDYLKYIITIVLNFFQKLFR